jgi:flagellin
MSLASMNINLTAGMRQNLYSLQGTANLMERTQSRLSSGQRVQSALDDPVNYFAAKGHTQRASDLASLKDSMGEAIQTVKAANNGIEAVTDLIAAAKSIANSAKASEDTVVAADLANQFNDVLDHIDFITEDTEYKGINLMGGTGETLTVEFDESGTSKITLTGFVGSTSSDGINVTDAGGWATSSEVSTSITELNSARDELRTESKGLSSKLSIISARQEFTAAMIGTLSDGAAALTDADMNEEGANMLMLQTRQQLGTTSLSLASQAAQSVLRLF